MTVANQHHRRQSFDNAHTSIGAHASMGAAGHWIKTVGILTPLLIPELTDDKEKQMRWVRLASLVTAVVSEGLWAHKVHKKSQHAHRQVQEYEQQLSSYRERENQRNGNRGPAYASP